MNGEIQSNSQDASSAAEVITSGLEEYCTFDVFPLFGYAPVAGSSAHDAMSDTIVQAFSSWRALLQSDAEAIKGIGHIFEELDEGIGLMLLGVEESYE